MYRKRKAGLIGILAGLSLTITVLAQVSTYFDLRWNLISGGGGSRSSPSYQVDDVLGQWTAGESSNSKHKIESGFISSLAQSALCYRLNLTRTGSGSDPAASPSKSTSCNNQNYFVAGETINLTASPADGWTVSGWNGTTNDTSTSETNSTTMPANDHTVRVIYSAQPDAYEVDNLCSQSKLIQVNGSLQEHTFHVAADTDWVRFDAAASTNYRVEVQTPTGSPADVNLAIYPGCELGPAYSFEETFTPGVRLDFTADTTGPLYVRLTNFDPDISGSNVIYRLSVRELQSDAQQGAVILLAGRLNVNDPLQPNIHHVIDTAYNLFKQQGFGDDQIHYLAIDPALPGSDQGATVANLQNAITSWAVDKVGPEKPLILYLMDHGDIDQLFIDETNQQHINPNDLNTWLNQLESAVPGVGVTVVIEACYSGSFIEGVQSISKPGRAIITSTSPWNVAFASAEGAQFSDQFLTNLSLDHGICMSFLSSQDAVLQLSNIQQPWIDANGNKVPNEDVDCEAANLLISTSGLLPDDSWAPYIVMAQATGPITDHKATIYAQVRDNIAVERVWAVVYKPSYVPPKDVKELVPEDMPRFDLAAKGNEIYSTEYTHFDEFGRYRIAIYAQDQSGLITGPYVIELQNGEQIFLPILTR